MSTKVTVLRSAASPHPGVERAASVGRGAPRSGPQYTRGNQSTRPDPVPPTPGPDEDIDSRRWRLPLPL